MWLSKRKSATNESDSPQHNEVCHNAHGPPAALRLVQVATRSYTDLYRLFAIGQEWTWLRRGPITLIANWKSVDAKKTCNCSTHGKQGIGLVCIHVAYATEERRRVGFFWGNQDDLSRPDAWCQACEDRLEALRDGDGDEWFKEADFKIFCALCWDHAKAVCGGFTD